MSISSKKVLVILVAAAFTRASAGALRAGPLPRQSLTTAELRRPYDDGRYDDGDAYDYAKVVDVQPLTTRVRVSTPQRECWDETRYDERAMVRRSGGMAAQVAGSTLLGAVIGAVIGNQIGHGHGRKAATAGGAVIGAAIGHQQGMRRSGYTPPPQRVHRAALRDALSRRMAGACRRLPRDLRVPRPPPGDAAAVSSRRSHPRARRREPGGVMTELFVMAVWAVASHDGDRPHRVSCAKR